MLEHGHALVQKADQDIDATIRAALGSRSTVSQRLEHCLDILAGRRSIYVHKPAGLHFPYLPAIQFFDRALFPWLESFEAQSSVILEELLRLIREGVTGGPYVRVAAGEPVNQWRDLNNSVDWSAVFLWKDGNRVDEIARRCPATMAALAKVSMLDIAGRGPTAMFSLLRPGTHIPPHHGVTNTRAVVHLPLIVPAGCRFRVGSETRAWPSGEAWIFDDTIEHEAWNDGTEMRAVLIFDVWNPYLDEAEKDALRVVDTVLQRFGKSDAGGSGI
ncbi:aspartyl/asparaginyl beta-hydroxylase domain-containing protein [Sphingomonas sanxanigenens]|nr:aspartyl/asparaginyl beta-hydroxylase domain-containing protein [Sphingomonas sanxanigenens]